MAEPILLLEDLRNIRGYLPDPTKRLRDGLHRQRRKILQLKKAFDIALQIKCRYQNKFSRAARVYESMDYKLAMKDGRYQKINTVEVEHKKEVAKVKRIVAKLNQTEKQELLKALMGG